MTIGDFLVAEGLNADLINWVIDSINIYNFRYSDNIIDINLSDNLSLIDLKATPIIGTAIAKLNGIEFIDSSQLKPITADNNAMQYALNRIRKYDNFNLLTA